MIRIFIGYDPRETVAFHVLNHSIQARATAPVSITPLKLDQLGELMWRKRHNLQSTDFSFSRFLVPHLCGYKGWALFMDCDMLMLDDVANLWRLRSNHYAVQCVKHDHQPSVVPKHVSAAGRGPRMVSLSVVRSSFEHRFRCNFVAKRMCIRMVNLCGLLGALAQMVLLWFGMFSNVEQNLFG